MEESSKEGSVSNFKIWLDDGYCFWRILFKSVSPSEKKAISPPEFMNNIMILDKSMSKRINIKQN
jgi:hypothetical protein